MQKLVTAAGAEPGRVIAIAQVGPESMLLLTRLSSSVLKDEGLVPQPLIDVYAKPGASTSAASTSGGYPVSAAPARTAVPGASLAALGDDADPTQATIGSEAAGGVDGLGGGPRFGAAHAPLQGVQLLQGPRQDSLSSNGPAARAVVQQLSSTVCRSTGNHSAQIKEMHHFEVDCGGRGGAAFMHEANKGRRRRGGRGNRGGVGDRGKSNVAHHQPIQVQQFSSSRPAAAQIPLGLEMGMVVGNNNQESGGGISSNFGGHRSAAVAGGGGPCAPSFSGSVNGGTGGGPMGVVFGAVQGGYYGGVPLYTQAVPAVPLYFGGEQQQRPPQTSAAGRQQPSWNSSRGGGRRGGRKQAPVALEWRPDVTS